MKKLVILILLFASTKQIASGVDSLTLTNDQWIKIDSINISGNNVTEDYIILRELSFSVNDSVNSQILDYNKERIYSLGIFNFVSVYASRTDDKILANINVSESWYFYPLPFLNVKNSDIEKSTYGMVFLWKNFRGRNETIDVKFGLGYDPFVALSYFNPIVWEEANLMLRYRFVYTNSSSKSLLEERLYGDIFDRKIYSSEIMIGKRLDLFNTVYSEIGYDYIENPKFIEGRLNASNNRIDRVPRISFIYQNDSRDLMQAPKNGNLSFISFTHKGFNLDNISYNKLYIDHREYREIVGNLSTKWRVAGRHMFGKTIPYYDNSMFGYDEYIRGHRGDEREGHNFLISSFELRYQLVEEWQLKLNLPLLPKRLTATRIGVFITSFFDAGLTFNNRTHVFARNRIDKGWGAGITILFLPHNAYRLEYAFDEHMKGEIIFGTGFSF